MEIKLLHVLCMDNGFTEILYKNPSTLLEIYIIKMLAFLYFQSNGIYTL